MGNCCPLGRFHRRSSANSPKNVTLLLVGLDNAGKTTIAKRLLQEPLDGVVPTVGFSRITLREKSCHVTIYDLGGGIQIRDIWPRYYADVHGVIFVIDAFNVERMNECKKVLEGVLMDNYISGKPVLILANKQDMEGALDEIDIVDILNVERLVNQQKCPTLVELCSATNFSRKIDEGIVNGYKWLLRCITKDYPSLNNRVLKDLATQEEFERIKRVQREERIKRKREERENGDNDIQSLTACTLNILQSYFTVQSHGNSTEMGPISEVSFQGEKYQNGTVQMVDTASIPGQIEDAPKNSISKISSRASKDVKEIYFAHSVSSSCEFFKYERDDNDIMLIQSMGDNYQIKNFLVRPKSSGPRLSSSRTDTSKKKTARRKSYQKNNKTAPSPVTDVILEPIAPPKKIFQHLNVNTAVESSVKYVRSEGENRDPVIEFACKRKTATQENGFRSTPGSRRESASSEKRRCMSGDQVNTSKAGKLLPLKISTNHMETELILDVTNLED